MDADLAVGRLTELFPDCRLAVPTPFNAVYYAGRAVSPKIRAFVDFLAEEWGRDTVFENRPKGLPEKYKAACTHTDKVQAAFR
ncbi:hypothetical protein [Eikenella halliae]|uniref:hypothetical protein n=1 Tax=Eikenella halliae TaxID=1795832 RepID=UPI00360DC936